MTTLLDFSVHQAVERDGLPRVAAYDDGSQKVLHLVGEIVHSVEVSDWPAPLPTDPTPAESAAAILAREAKQKEARDKAAMKKQRILALATDAVGQPIDRLSPRQLGAILAILHPDLVDDALEVRPLDEWMGE